LNIVISAVNKSQLVTTRKWTASTLRNRCIDISGGLAKTKQPAATLSSSIDCIDILVTLMLAIKRLNKLSIELELVMVKFWVFFGTGKDNYLYILYQIGRMRK
jgi:hypothetical protein